MPTQIKEMTPFINVSINEDQQIGVQFTPQIEWDAPSLGKCLARTALCIAESVRLTNHGDEEDRRQILAEVTAEFNRVSDAFIQSPLKVILVEVTENLSDQTPP